MTFHVNHDELPEVTENRDKSEVEELFEEIIENLNTAYDRLDSATADSNDLEQTNLSDAIYYVSSEVSELIEAVEKRLKEFQK
jgi:hypothetical protein